jgi:hypothetical protein
MGGGATKSDEYKASDLLKDYAQAVAMLGAAVAAAGAVPEPASPVVVGAGVGMLVGAGIAYAAGAAADAAGY